MIVRNKDILENKWRIKGTRISVELIIKALYAYGIDWILKEYPTITLQDIADCLNFYVNDKKLGD